MYHPEKSKDIQFYLFGQIYALKKTRKKMDETVQKELFDILPEYAINQCLRCKFGYKAELTSSSRRHLQFLKETLNKLPPDSKADILQLIQNRQSTVIAHLVQKLYQTTTGENGYKSVSPLFDTQVMENAKERSDMLSRYPYALYTQTHKGRAFIFNKLFKSAMTIHVLLEKDLNAFLKQVEKREKNKVVNVVQQVGIDMMSVVFPETIKPLSPNQIRQQEPIPNVRQVSQQKQLIKE